MRDSVWRKWLDRLLDLEKNNARRRRPARLKPRLEEMESRLTPASPTVAAISRLAPAFPNVTTSSVQYTILFDQSVAGVDATDFRVTTAGGATATPTISVGGNGPFYIATVSGIRGNGPIRLDLIDDDSIQNFTSEPLGGAGAFNGSFQGQSYNVLQAYPSVISIVAATPGNAATNAKSVSFVATFNTPVTGVDPTDFAIVATGNIGTGLTQVSQLSSNAYIVTVSGITGSGTLGIKLLDDGTIRDAVGNPLTTSSAAATFSPQQSFAAGANPHAVAAGDVNGDGKADLVVGNFTGNTISVLLGNGTGAFQGQKTFAAGTGPSSVALADVNGDGKLDAVVANSNTGGAGSLGVLLGNGDGSFQGQTTFAVGTYPAAVRATDLNGDGKPDLASANRDGSVSILLGNGNGSFKPQMTFAANTSPNSLAVDDFNFDTRPDLVVANRDSADVSVLLGNGDGSFQRQTTFAVGVSPRTVAVADVNGDNRTDLVIANRGVNITTTSVGVLLGNGDGSFQSQITYTADRPYAAAVADINGDGKPDAVTFYRSISLMSALLGNGDGSFQSQKSFATVGSNPYALAVADLNGDGKVDLVTANSVGNSASVLVNAFNGDFSSQTYTIDNTAPLVQSINRGTPAGPTAPSGTVTFVVTFNEAVTGVDVTDFALATTNSLGTISLVTPVSESVYNVTVNDATVTGTATTGTLGLNLVDSGSIRDSAGNVLINPNAPAAFFGQQTFATGANPRLGAVGDVNGDGQPDLVVVNVNANSISLLLGNGGGTFQTQATFATGGTALSAALGDVNGDGKLDIAFANYTRNSVNVLLGNGNGTFQAQQTFAAGVNPTSVAVADFNGDGKTDVAVSNNASAVSVLLGNGNGAFQAPQSFGAGPITRSLVAGDVNSDGKADLVVANFGNNSTSVLLGNGNGSFQAQKTFATGTFPLSVAISDLNGDGKPDLAVANRGQNNIGILLGNGDGGFQAQRTFATGVRPYSVAVGDLNGDGKVDLAAANQSSNSTSILFGNGNGTFQGQQSFAAGSLPSGAFLNDLNGDGKLDIAVANGGGDSVGVLLGNGTTIFTTGQTYTISAPNNPTTTTLAASPASPQPLGTAITLTATISPAGAATGKVQFKDGSVNLGTPQDVTLVGGVPTATLTTTAIGAGTRSLTAVYLGSGDFRSSTSNALTFVTTAVATTTTLLSNPNPSTGGTQVSFTAIILPNPGTGTHGSVTFKDNGTTIGTAPVVDGIASFQIGTLGVGQHPITATFSGDDAAGYAASTSNIVTQTVSGSPTTTTLSTGTPNPAGITQAITFTVTIAGGGSTNGESVKLIDFSNAGAEVPVTGNVLSGGTATLTVAPGTFSVGTHSLVVLYAGNNVNSSSLSNLVTQSVGVAAPAPSVVSVTVNGNLPSLVGPQRSRVASIVVVFDRAVQLDADAMRLVLHTNGVSYNDVAQPTGYGSLPTALALNSTDKITWTVTFTGNTDDGADGIKSLKDGVYDFVITGSKVHPDGVPAISMAANSTTVVHRLFGDSNAPATPNGGIPNVDFLAVVNTGDNLAFRGSFNNAANYKAYFDFNGDGVINSGDNLQFRSRFNKALTWKV